LYSASTHKRVC